MGNDGCYGDLLMAVFNYSKVKRKLKWYAGEKTFGVEGY